MLRRNISLHMSTIPSSQFDCEMNSDQNVMDIYNSRNVAHSAVCDNVVDSDNYKKYNVSK